jgi:hypothetical protein
MKIKVHCCHKKKYIPENASLCWRRDFWEHVLDKPVVEWMSVNGIPEISWFQVLALFVSREAFYVTIFGGADAYSYS